MPKLLTASLLSALLGLCACTTQPVRSPGTSPYALPMSTIFKGEEPFHEIIAKAEAGQWRNLPIGERTMQVAGELLGTPYANFTLEVDDHIEAPVVNLHALDCWTFYENALAIARMIRHQAPPYRPEDMLRYVELERYRNGRCDGTYLSRMHHLEEVFADNQRRGLATNITPNIPSATPIRRTIQEMTTQWRSYRYLCANPALLDPMAELEARISQLPISHIPKSRVRNAETYLNTGDICAITTNSSQGYTSHVGLILKKNGRAHFVHATSDRDKGRRVIIDKPITNYLHELPKHAGIIICRPHDLPNPPSP